MQIDNVLIKSVQVSQDFISLGKKENTYWLSFEMLSETNVISVK